MLSFILKGLYFISMSDILSPVASLKFQDCIHLTDHSPKIVNKLRVDTTAVALTLKIYNHFLLYIENCRCNSGFTYVKICNTQVSFLQLLKCDRLEIRIRPFFISNYENLNLADNDLLKRLVFLLDKFCVSDAAYYELSTIYDDMPPKYDLPYRKTSWKQARCYDKFKQ